MPAECGVPAGCRRSHPSLERSSPPLMLATQWHLRLQRLVWQVSYVADVCPERLCVVCMYVCLPRRASSH